MARLCTKRVRHGRTLGGHVGHYARQHRPAVVDTGVDGVTRQEAAARERAEVMYEALVITTARAYCATEAGGRYIY